MFALLLITVALVAGTMATAVVTGRLLIERKREAFRLAMAGRKARQTLSELCERHSLTAASQLTLERIKAEKERARDQLYAELMSLRHGERDRRQVTVKRALKWQRLNHEGAAA